MAILHQKTTLLVTNSVFHQHLYGEICGAHEMAQEGEEAGGRDRIRSRASRKLFTLSVSYPVDNPAVGGNSPMKTPHCPTNGRKSVRGRFAKLRWRIWSRGYKTLYASGRPQCSKRYGGEAAPWISEIDQQPKIRTFLHDQLLWKENDS